MLLDGMYVHVLLYYFTGFSLFNIISSTCTLYIHIQPCVYVHAYICIKYMISLHAYMYTHMHMYLHMIYIIFNLYTLYSAGALGAFARVRRMLIIRLSWCSKVQTHQ